MCVRSKQGGTNLEIGQDVGLGHRATKGEQDGVSAPRHQHVCVRRRLTVHLRILEAVHGEPPA